VTLAAHVEQVKPILLTEEPAMLLLHQCSALFCKL